MSDATFVTDILKSLPGVDFEDPQIQSIIAGMGNRQPGPTEKGEDDEDLEAALKMSMDLDKEEKDKTGEGQGEGQ